MRLMVLLVVACSLLAAGCGQDAPELTIEERLANVEGRVLTEAEVADKLATAGILCQLDGQVLDAIWRQLNERQLNYQDVVFGHICPDRSVFYAGLTGRYVTDEARESGVVPSTTRATVADPTTTTSAPRATIVPAPTSSQAAGGSEGTDPPDSSALTIVPQPSTTPREGEGG